jgi:hypothetical protein
VAAASIMRCAVESDQTSGIDSAVGNAQRGSSVK